MADDRDESGTEILKRYAMKKLVKEMEDDDDTPTTPPAPPKKGFWDFLNSPNGKVFLILVGAVALIFASWYTGIGFQSEWFNLVEKKAELDAAAVQPEEVPAPDLPETPARASAPAASPAPAPVRVVPIPAPTSVVRAEVPQGNDVEVGDGGSAAPEEMEEEDHDGGGSEEDGGAFE